MERLRVGDYFKLPESLGPMELVYGVTRAAGAAVQAPVRCDAPWRPDGSSRQKHGLGEVCLAPVDVVLDAPRASVVLSSWNTPVAEIFR